MAWTHSRRRRCPVDLTAEQYQTIMFVAAGLPEPRRHSFLLHVAQKLKLSTKDNGFPSPVLLQKVLADALFEVPA